MERRGNNQQARRAGLEVAILSQPSVLGNPTRQF